MIHFDEANVCECRKYDLLIFCDIIFGGPTGGPNGGLRSQLSGLRSQVSGLRSQVSGLRSQVSCLMSQVSGLWSSVSGLRSQVSVLGWLLGVLGTICLPLEVFMGYPGCAWGMGSANQQFQSFCNFTGPAQETYQS